MFTGLVRQVGEVTVREPRDEGIRFVFAARELALDLGPGDSVAIDGACLTVAELGGSGFAVDAVPATLSRTTLGEFEPGRRVNLEPALRAGEPLGGHLVQGHVDAVGEVVEALGEREALVVRVALPQEVARFTVARGSIALDGVSLTVAELSGGVAQVAIIPYTLGHTNLDRLAAGSRVNLEADLIGKYVAQMLEPHAADDRPPGAASGRTGRSE